MLDKWLRYEIKMTIDLKTTWYIWYTCMPVDIELIITLSSFEFHLEFHLEFIENFGEKKVLFN